MIKQPTNEISPPSLDQKIKNWNCQYTVYLMEADACIQYYHTTDLELVIEYIKSLKLQISRSHSLKLLLLNHQQRRILHHLLKFL